MTGCSREGATIFDVVGNLIKDDIAIDLDRANKRFHAGYPVNMTSAAVDPQTSLGLAEGPALFQSTSVSLNRCVNKPALFPQAVQWLAY